MSELIEFEVDREKLAAYIEIQLLLVGFFCFGVGLIVVWLWLRFGLRDDIRRSAEAYRCYLSEDRLVVKGCFRMWGLTWSNTEASIPLEKITDVKLVQGPILAKMGLWKLLIQTAGSTMQQAEATLAALKAPQESRDHILEAINTRVSKTRAD
jgi:putative membrane protein